MRAVIAGPDEDGLGTALESQGVETAAVEGVASRPALEDAGVHDADLFVLTDVGQATAIAVAKDVNPKIRVVVYDDDTIPEFARNQAGLIVDPNLLSADAVAEELTA
ncbi:CTP synthetase [Haladaptatus pallidirubidus]|uniref:CTP synthetase n=1 Tax=Haladaptatus pallidirubidus TaxID=1008152 RepID=A0AAV3UEG6_9EURY|nr:CTP synthetase [Haladaptatus pallidirubidus]